MTMTPARAALVAGPGACWRPPSCFWREPRSGFRARNRGPRRSPGPSPRRSSTPRLCPAREMQVAVLAGGCFWGVQGVFQHMKGVTSAVSGYAGGDKKSAHYNMVSAGTTGHAETVRVTFDPRQISYGRILQVFFSVAHDPTQLNRQGPDTGTQYRSAIFTENAEQAKIAKAYIDQLNQGRPVRRGDRHQGPAARGLLPRGEVPPGLSGAESRASLHRDQRPPEGRKSQARLSGCLSAGSGPGRHDRHGELILADARQLLVRLRSPRRGQPSAWLAGSRGIGLTFWQSTIFSENRYPLFGIML